MDILTFFDFAGLFNDPHEGYKGRQLNPVYVETSGNSSQFSLVAVRHSFTTFGILCEKNGKEEFIV